MSNEDLLSHRSEGKCGAVRLDQARQQNGSMTLFSMWSREPNAESVAVATAASSGGDSLARLLKSGRVASAASASQMALLQPSRWLALLTERLL